MYLNRFAALSALLASSMLSTSIGAAPLSLEQILPAETPTVAGTGWSVANGTGTDPAHIVSVQLPASSPTMAASFRYDINVDHDANYTVWLRVYMPVNDNNSVDWSLDGVKFETQWAAKSDQWQWLKLTTKGLKKGVTSLYLSPRRLGMKVDSVMFTALPLFTPVEANDVPVPKRALPSVAWSAPRFTPATGRPRVFVNAEDVTAVNGRLDSKVESIAKIRLVAALKRLKDAADEKNLTNDKCADDRKYIQGNALFHLLGKDDADNSRASKAIARMKTHIDECADIANPDTRAIGLKLTLMAIVYDWCYDLLDEQTKDLFQRRFIELSSQMEIGFPPQKQGSVVGHGSEAQLLRDQLSAAIAFHDDERGSVNRIFDIVAGRVIADFVPARNYAYQSLAMPQGTDYGPYRHQWDLFSALLFRAIGQKDIYSPLQKEVIHQNLYLRRPDGQYMRDGDVFNSASTKPISNRSWKQQIPFLLSANLYGDCQSQGGYLSELAEWEDDLWVVLYTRTDVETCENNLPLTKFFPDPLGMMVARTAWEKDKSPVIVTMKVGSTYFANHQHLDAGHFQIYYKGALAIDSGIYHSVPDDRDAYNSAHRWNYHMRTVAHNALLIHRDRERFGNYASNDGGQKLVVSEPSSVNDLKANYVRGATLAHAIGPRVTNGVPEYSYLKGDLAGAYGGKASQYDRSFVFLHFGGESNPAALVVLDRVTKADPGFETTWLLHSIEKPSPDGKTVTIPGPGDTDAGKLVNTTLFPGSASISIVGPPSHGAFEVDNWDGGSANYPITKKLDPDTWEEPGEYRVEVKPGAPANDSDVFLNVIQVMDGNASAYPVTAIDGDFIGAVLNGRAVLFRKPNQVGQPRKFTLPGSGTVKVLITDLEAGDWTLTPAVGTATPFSVASPNGTGYVTVQAGIIHTVAKSGSTPTSSATVQQQ